MSQRNRICPRCSTPYPPGGYAIHKTLPMHLEAPIRPRTRRVWTEDRLAELRGLAETGATYRTIASHYGLSFQRISRLLTREGITRKGKRDWSRQPTCFICNSPYVDWAEHQSSEEHQKTAAMFIERLEALSRSSAIFTQPAKELP